MWNDLPLIPEMRSILRAALPGRAFLRRDRGDGLFISNAPAFGFVPDEIPGFLVRKDGGLIRIRPDALWLQRLEALYPDVPDDFCRSLMRFRGAEISEEALGLFCEGMKLLDAGDGAPKGEIMLFDRNVRQFAARALRKERSGGGLYALSLLDAMLKK